MCRRAPARPPDGAAASDDARPGRVRFEMAETKFNLGRFEEAAVDYQAAYEAEPLPAFLFNIGQCYRNLGNYERAQFYFRRYVQLDPRSPNRADAEQLIAEMDRMAAGTGRLRCRRRRRCRRWLPRPAAVRGR